MMKIVKDDTVLQHVNRAVIRIVVHDEAFRLKQLELKHDFFHLFSCVVVYAGEWNDTESRVCAANTIPLLLALSVASEIHYWTYGVFVVLQIIMNNSNTSV